MGFRKIEEEKGMTVRKHPVVITVLRYRLGIGSKVQVIVFYSVLGRPAIPIPIYVQLSRALLST